MTEPALTNTEAAAPAPEGPPPSLLRRAGAAVLFAFAAVVVVAGYQACIAGAADQDGLYQFRHAAQYLRYGVTSSHNPFSYCAIGRLGADIWYGFHLFLLPFARFRDPLLGVQAAAVAEAALALVLLYLVARRFGLPYPWGWPFLLVLFSPTAAHILLKARPHVLSAGLAPLVLCLLITGPAWGVALAAAVLTFVHPSFLWVVPLLVGIVLPVQRVCERTWNWRGAAAAAAGVAVGLLARPHPIVAAKLQYIQLVTLQLARRQHLNIDWGLELDPMSLARFTERFLLMPVLWGLALLVLVAALVRRAELAPRQRTALVTSALGAAFFLAMTLGASYRATPLWTAFTAVSIATIFGYLVVPPAARLRWMPSEVRMLLAAALGLFVAMLGWDSVEKYAILREWRAAPTNYMQEAGTWLRDHSRPGDLVANVSWDTFRTLYFWSPDTRYLYGMDPVFLYQQDPVRFWKVRHLNDGASDRTSGTPVYEASRSVSTYDFLARDLRARYLVLQPPRLPALHAYVASDPRFVHRCSDRSVEVYEILPPPAPRKGPGPRP